MGCHPWKKCSSFLVKATNGRIGSLLGSAPDSVPGGTVIDAGIAVFLLQKVLEKHYVTRRACLHYKFLKQVLWWAKNIEVLNTSILTQEFWLIRYSELVTYLLTYLPTYSLTRSLEQSLSWEANWFSASHEIPRISWNPDVHYRSHKCPSPVSILSQLDPVHAPTSWRSILILSYHLCQGLPSGLFSSCFPTKTLYTPLFPPYVLHALPISFAV